MHHRKLVREIERRSNVRVTKVEHTGGNHLKLILPNGRFVIVSLSGDGNTPLAAARDIKRSMKGLT